MKPDNILVDYDVVNNKAINFKMAIGDWGTSGIENKHYGGTPMYASSQAFQTSTMKDLFAFGRIALESIKFLVCSLLVWLSLAFIQSKIIQCCNGFDRKCRPF